MALSKKALTWVIIIAVIVVVIAIIVYFVTRDKVPQPTEPVPAGSPTPTWQPETFPLNVGMYGTKIKALQKALGVAQDGKLGPVTKGAITAKGYAMPLSQADYNIIISTSGGSAASNIKGVYAKFDNTIVRNKDLSQNRVAKKDEWLGTGSGTDSTGTYWELDGNYYVLKTATYLKG